MATMTMQAQYDEMLTKANRREIISAQRLYLEDMCEREFNKDINFLLEGADSILFDKDIDFLLQFKTV